MSDAEKLERVERLAEGWVRAYAKKMFREPPDRPDGAKLGWVDPETGEVLSEPFAVDRVSAAMGRHMAKALVRALEEEESDGD